MKCQFLVVAVACVVCHLSRAYGLCDVTIICSSCGMLPALAVVILLPVLNCAMQLWTCLFLKAAVYFTLKMTNICCWCTNISYFEISLKSSSFHTSQRWHNSFTGCARAAFHKVQPAGRIWPASFLGMFSILTISCKWINVRCNYST